MLDQIELQKVLVTTLEKIKKKNPSYSMRAFSKKIGLSPSALSEFLNGQRRISFKRAQVICNNLDLSESDKAGVLSFFDTPTQQPSLSYKVCPDISGEYGAYFGDELNTFNVSHSGFLSLSIDRTSHGKTSTTHYILDGVFRPLPPFEDYFVVAGMHGTPNELRGQKLMFKKNDGSFYTVTATFRLDKNRNLLMAQKSFLPDGTLYRSHTALLVSLKNGTPLMKYDLATRMVP